MSVEAVAIKSIGTLALWPAATTWHVPAACLTVVLKATVSPRVSRSHTFFFLSYPSNSYSCGGPQVSSNRSRRARARLGWISTYAWLTSSLGYPLWQVFTFMIAYTPFSCSAVAHGTDPNHESAIRILCCACKRWQGCVRFRRVAYIDLPVEALECTVPSTRSVRQMCGSAPSSDASIRARPSLKMIRASAVTKSPTCRRFMRVAIGAAPIPLRGAAIPLRGAVPRVG